LLDTLVLPIARAQKPKWCMRIRDWDGDISSLND
jgi:hypothetical protein